MFRRTKCLRGRDEAVRERHGLPVVVGSAPTWSEARSWPNPCAWTENRGRSAASRARRLAARAAEKAVQAERRALEALRRRPTAPRCPSATRRSRPVPLGFARGANPLLHAMARAVPCDIFPLPRAAVPAAPSGALPRWRQQRIQHQRAAAQDVDRAVRALNGLFLWAPSAATAVGGDGGRFRIHVGPAPPSHVAC